MKKQIMIVALTSLFATSVATELNLQLDWDGANMVASDIPTHKARPSANISSLPMSKPRDDSENIIVTPAFQVAIHPEDANAGSSPMYDIKSSGRYYLSNDFRIAGTSSGASFIRINADNVTLNLNAKVIVPHISATQTNFVGISNNNRDNAMIMNGTIQCTPPSGSGRITTGLSLGSSTAYSVKVHDLFINQATTTGITGSNLNDLSLERVASNNASGSAAVTGGTFTSCKNVVMLDCEFNRNTTSSGNCRGLVLSGCEDGLLSNVVASGNTTTSTTAGHVASGIQLASSSVNNYLKQCNASNNSSAGQSSDDTMHSIGIEINASPLNKLENCVTNGNGGSSGSDNNAVGIHVIGASNNTSLIKCEASRNRAEDSSATTPVANGIRIDGDGSAIHNILLDGCVTNYNEAGGTAPGDVAGVYAAGMSNSVIKNHESSKNLADIADAYGIYMSQAGGAGNENNIVQDSTCVANTASSATKNAVGFYSTAGTNNRWVKCKGNAQSAGAGSTATQGSGGAGFHLLSETRSQVVECEATGNQTATHANAFAYGILVLNGTSCAIKDCYAAYNSAGGSGKHFGIYDGQTSNNSTATSTFMLSNTSVGHGKCLTSAELNTSMQFIISSNLPSASLNYFFSHPGTGSNPQHMIHEVPKWNLASLSTTVKLWENVSVY